MALPHQYKPKDSSLLSGIEPLPLSSPTSPLHHVSRSPSPTPALSFPSAASLRRAAFSEVTTQLYSSLRRSKDLEVESQDTEYLLGNSAASRSPTHVTDMDELADEMSHKLQEGVAASSAKGVSYISQMESLRSYLQNMLSFNHSIAQQSRHVSDKDEEQSDATTTLLNARPVSPTRSLSGLEGLFPHYTSLYKAAPAFPDLQLRDALERETTRRKHLERHIQNLQNEMLELQQRLTVTLTADSRKDTMIQQLDQTLALVVGGWKQQEQKKEETLHQLCRQKEKAEQARAKDMEVLTQVRQELCQAQEALAEEKQISAEAKEEAHKLVEEKETLVTRFQAEQERERDIHAEERRELETLKRRIQEQQSEWLERERQLQGQCERLQEEKRREVESERALVQQESQKSQQQQLVLASLQGEVLRLERDLQASHRERDTLQMELNLEKARGESERVRLESEHKVRLEEAVIERLSVVHEESAQHLSAVREQHRRQLLDLTSQHETELTTQLSQFKSELQDRERRHRDVTMEYEHKLSHLEEKTQELSLALRRLENERAEMLTQLQDVMKSHWSQALRVLTSKASESSLQAPLLPGAPELPWSGSREAAGGPSQDQGEELPLKRSTNSLGPGEISDVMESSKLKDNFKQIIAEKSHTDFNQHMQNSGHIYSTSQMQVANSRLMGDGGQSSHPKVPLSLSDSQWLMGHSRQDGGQLISQQSDSQAKSIRDPRNQPVIADGSLFCSQPLVTIDTSRQNTFADSLFKDSRRQPVIGKSHLNVELLEARGHDTASRSQLVHTGGHSTFLGSHEAVDSRHQYIKGLTGQHDSDGHQTVTGKVPTSQPSFRPVSLSESGPGQESRHHPNYQPAEAFYSYREADESFYPLQMEELSHSFSSHPGFYSLEPQQDRTTLDRASESLLQISAKQSHPEEPSLMFGPTKPNTLDTTPNWEPNREDAPSNTQLQYYIRMLLDRAPGDPLNDETDKEPPHPNIEMSDLSRLLNIHPSMSQYGQSRPNQQLQSSTVDVPRIPAKPSKNPEVVKKEMLPTRRRAAPSRGVKRVTSSGGRGGIWR
ncbi:centrobin isoform X1 [Xenopus laevis]|uniref:Centrobin isoform X1 n=1 Tax=Xenopus laevis TaxID=8355 RepID=A0A8J0UX06_XENLA|nr:centrobin isoform X1 [Xenopus laevis]